MGPLIAVLAGVMSQQMQAAKQRKQAQADLHARYAQQLSPGISTAGLDAARTNAAIDDSGGEMVAKFLPYALEQMGNEPSAMPSIGEDQGLDRAFDQVESRQRNRGMAGFDAAPNRLDDWGW